MMNGFQHGEDGDDDGSMEYEMNLDQIMQV